MLSLPQKIKSWFEVDMIIGAIYIVLSVFGLVMIYSASSYFSLSEYGNSEYFLFRQLSFLGAGFILALLAANASHKVAETEWSVRIFYGALILALLVVFTQVPQNGARSWIRLGAVNLQPSEFGKLVLVWVSAYYYSKNRSVTKFWDFFKMPIIMTGIVVLLVAVQPDFGTDMIIVLIVWLLALMTGFSKWAIVWSGALMVFGYSLTYLPVSVLEYIPLKPYQLARFMSFHNPWDDATGSGYQSIQGFLALARGGLTGTGLSSSVQKTGFLPEAHTDFIMAIVGEELGIIVVLLVLAILFGLILYIFWKGQRCQELFARYICYGVGIFFLVQTSVNIGALLGLAPITGVPLPFISYGGSSYFVSSIAIGMVLFALKYDDTKTDIEEMEDIYEESISR